MKNENDFRKYAVKHLGMNGSRLDSYMNITSDYGYISPTIIEERQLNVAQMDVFSRLMMDRIIFLGTQIDEYAANVVQAQLLYLDSSDPGKDISLYINSPGGTVYAGYGIYDTMQFISSDVSTICTGIAASMAAVLLVAGTPKKRFALPHSRVMIPVSYTHLDVYKRQEHREGWEYKERSKSGEGIETSSFPDKANIS